jgi:hypothetical protein
MPLNPKPWGCLVFDLLFVFVVNDESKEKKEVRMAKPSGSQYSSFFICHCSTINSTTVNAPMPNVPMCNVHSSNVQFSNSKVSHG